MFIHTRKGVFSEDGVNKASIQFGTGAAKTLNSGFETFTLNGQTFIRADDPDSWRLRVTENFTANLSDSFSLGPVLIYQITDYAGDEGKVQWVSAGVRPIWHFDQHISLALEAGADWVKDDNAKARWCALQGDARSPGVARRPFHEPAGRPRIRHVCPLER